MRISIVCLLRELADYEKLHDRFSLTEDAVTRDMMGAACHCDLAFVGDEAAGLASWYWTYDSFRAARGLFIEDLYVRPAFRGQGLGKALLAHLAGKARAAERLPGMAGAGLEHAFDRILQKPRRARPLGQWLNYWLEGEGLEDAGS